ncbi:hypothetical protein [Kitasatospora griseola]
MRDPVLAQQSVQAAHLGDQAGTSVRAAAMKSRLASSCWFGLINSLPPM